MSKGHASIIKRVSMMQMGPPVDFPPYYIGAEEIREPGDNEVRVAYVHPTNIGQDGNFLYLIVNTKRERCVEQSNMTIQTPVHILDCALMCILDLLEAKDLSLERIARGGATLNQDLHSCP